MKKMLQQQEEEGKQEAISLCIKYLNNVSSNSRLFLVLILATVSTFSMFTTNLYFYYLSTENTR